jgi:ABC-2 type transport system ATP-binding protein
MAMSYAVEATKLTKRFGRRTAVDRLTLQVPTGCVYGFLGPNGAGKTTTMRLLLGLLRPQAGSVRLLGRDLARDRIAAMRSVGALIEMPALYEHLSGRANLDITRSLLRLPRSEVDRVLALVDLDSAADRRVAGYSLGMKQRLALGRALLGGPKLLLLDEPTNGLDPDGIVSMRDLIRDLPGRTGATVFMSSHLLSEVEQTATVAGLMSDGRLLLQKSVAELTAGRSLAFELSDPQRGAEVLSRNKALEIRLDGAAGLHVALPQGADPRDVAARCNRALVEDGLEVSAVSLGARSLEQTYRDAVAAQEGARA